MVSLVCSQRLLCEAVWVTRAGMGTKEGGKGEWECECECDAGMKGCLGVDWGVVCVHSTAAAAAAAASGVMLCAF